MNENALTDQQDTCYIKNQDELIELLNTIQSLNQILADEKQNKQIDENTKAKYYEKISPFKKFIYSNNCHGTHSFDEKLPPYKLSVSGLIEKRKIAQKAINNIDKLVNHSLISKSFDLIGLDFEFRSIMRNENKYPNVLSDEVLKNTKSVIAFDKQKDYLANIEYKSIKDFFSNAHKESIPNVAEFIPWFKNKFGNKKINKESVGGSMDIVFNAFGTNSVSDFNQLFEFIEPNELGCFFYSDEYCQAIKRGAIKKVDESILKCLPKHWFDRNDCVSNLKRYCGVGAFDDFDLNTWKDWCKLLGVKFKPINVLKFIRDVLAFFRFDRINSWIYNLVSNKVTTISQHNDYVKNLVLRIYKDKKYYKWIIDNQEKSRKAKEEQAKQNLLNQNNKQENKNAANDSVFKNLDESLTKTSTNDKFLDSNKQQQEQY